VPVVSLPARAETPEHMRPLVARLPLGVESMTDQIESAPGGRRVGEGDTWTRAMVECGPWEARCRRAYDAAGWPAAGWAYDFMPEWLKPGWHHEGPATHVMQSPHE
jgi:hypothetical protein